MKGSGLVGGALRLPVNIEEVKCVRVKLREVDLVWHVPVGGDAQNWRQVIVQVGLLHGELEITFSLPGAEPGETIPASVIEGIQQAVAWARKNVKVKDLVEMDPEQRETE